MLKPALAALVGGLVVGRLTSFGQTWLPDEWRSMANCAGAWCVAAFVLVLPARRVEQARVAALSMALAVVAMLAMLAGYYLTAELRGFGTSSSSVLFWVAAAVVAGPVVGATAAALRPGADSRRAALGAGAVAGILVGESAYGLVVVGDTTEPDYWVIQAVAGLAFVVVAGLRRRWRPAPWGLACTALVVATGSFFIGYQIV